MNKETMRHTMAVAVSLTCAKLTDLELEALNLVAQLDGSPYGRMFNYEAVKSLFTEEGGTRMHEETKLALKSVVTSRLG